MSIAINCEISSSSQAISARGAIERAMAIRSQNRVSYASLRAMLNLAMKSGFV